MRESTTKEASESAREFSPLTKDVLLNAEGSILISRFDIHGRPRDFHWLHRYYLWSPSHNRLWSVDADDPSSLTIHGNPSSHKLKRLTHRFSLNKPTPIFVPLQALPTSFEHYYAHRRLVTSFHDHSRAFAERLCSTIEELRGLLNDVNRERKEALAAVHQHFRDTAKPRLGEELLGLANDTFRHHS